MHAMPDQEASARTHTGTAAAFPTTLRATTAITLPMDIAGRNPDRQWLTRVIDMGDAVLGRMRLFDSKGQTS
ncbi:hypothetical protein ABZ370_15920 [Streptomyces sp. NPDC005962]|uniref:hypothetical protein n=1 Tax=Streptomyces sp. NPDC005962 TaxID=3154466 RepID=UPI0033FDF3AF